MFLLDTEGSKLGVVPTHVALGIAQENGLDLVQVHDGDPPVAKIMSFSHYRYLQQRKERAIARSARQSSHVHQVRLRTTIDDHDYATKLDIICKFLEKGERVHVTVVSKGRMSGKPELAERLVERLTLDTGEAGRVSSTHAGPRETRLVMDPKVSR